MCVQNWPASAATPSCRPAPSRPIARGIAGPGLLAHVLVAKFANHLPLYRQSVIYAREALNWSERCWRTGLVPPAPCCARYPAPCARLRQTARRRHANSGAGAGQWQDENSAAVDLRAWRQRLRRHHTRGGLVCLHAGPQRRPSANSPGQHQGRVAGRCVCRFNALYVDGTIQEAAC